LPLPDYPGQRQSYSGQAVVRRALPAGAHVPHSVFHHAEPATSGLCRASPYSRRHCRSRWRIGGAADAPSYRSFKTQCGAPLQERSRKHTIQKGQCMTLPSAGQRFRDAVASEHPLQVVGAINANHALLAKRAGFKAIYLSGGGVAAGSLGLPDLGITNLDDVLTDVRRITDVCDLPLLVDVDTGFGSSAFNVARTVKSMIKFGAAAIHIEDQVGAKRCGHRPNKEIVSQQEMVDRIKAAVDARTDDSFVIMARTDALAVEGLNAALDRAAACVEAGADMVFPEAITELAMYKTFADRVKAPILANITEFGATPLYTTEE